MQLSRMMSCPSCNARILADKIPLEKSHRMEFTGGHYTAALWLPVVVDHFSKSKAAMKP